MINSLIESLPSNKRKSTPNTVNIFENDGLILGLKTLRNVVNTTESILTRLKSARTIRIRLTNILSVKARAPKGSRFSGILERVIS